MLYVLFPLALIGTFALLIWQYQKHHMAASEMDKALEDYWIGKGFTEVEVQQLSAREQVQYGTPLRGMVQTDVLTRQLTQRYRPVTRKVYLTGPDGKEDTLYVQASYANKQLKNCTVLAHFEG